MNQGTILGSQIGRWVVLAAVVALLGALLLTIRPVGAQTPPTGCDPVGRGEAREYVCNLTYAENGTGPVKNLGALDRDIRQVVKVWELVTDAGDADLRGSPERPGLHRRVCRLRGVQDRPRDGRAELQESAGLRESPVDCHRKP